MWGQNFRPSRPSLFFAAYHHRLRRPSHTFSRKRLSRPHSLITWRDNAVISPEDYSLSLSLFLPISHPCVHAFMDTCTVWTRCRTSHMWQMNMIRICGSHSQNLSIPSDFIHGWVSVYYMQIGICM